MKEIFKHALALFLVAFALFCAVCSICFEYVNERLVGFINGLNVKGVRVEIDDEKRS